MKRLLVFLAVALSGPALADPNAPLTFQMEPGQYHAYRDDPPPPLTLTLTLRNPTTRPVPLMCLTVGAPVLKRFTAYQDYREVGTVEHLGPLDPQGQVPTCRRVGEIISVPPRTSFTYTRALGPQKVGAQVEYVAGWNVSLRPGFGWLGRASASALVVPEDRPIPTPNIRAYEQALGASRARWQTVGRGTGRLVVRLADEHSRDAFLAELSRRGLDPGRVDIEVAPPVGFPGEPSFAHEAAVTAIPTSQGYRFTLKVTNRSSAPVQGGARSACEPLAVERVSDGVRVWQVGNGPCIDVGMPSVTLRPGQSNTREARWNGADSLGQRVSPGQYRVRMGLGQFVGEALFTVK